jgi:hypothetical protein
MKAYWGSEGIAPLILDLGIRWRWVVSFMPRPLYPQGKSPWYPLDRRLDGTQSRSGRGGLEKNSQPPSGIEPQNSDRPVRSPALYRLRYRGCPRHGCEDNIIMDVGEIGWEGVDWIHLAQELVAVPCEHVMNRRVPEMSGNFLSSWETVSFSRTFLFCGVSQSVSQLVS